MAATASLSKLLEYEQMKNTAPSSGKRCKKRKILFYSKIGGSTPGLLDFEAPDICNSMMGRGCS